MAFVALHFVQSVGLSGLCKDAGVSGFTCLQSRIASDWQVCADLSFYSTAVGDSSSHPAQGSDCASRSQAEGLGHDQVGILLISKRQYS